MRGANAGSARAGTIRPRLWLCNAALCAALASACHEETPVAPVRDAARPPASAAPATEAPPVLPRPIRTLFEALPDPPMPALAPGATASDVRRTHPDARASTYTDRILQVRLTGDPFDRVSYQLGAAGDQVEAVLLTFAEGWRPHRAALEQAIAARLGEGKAFQEAPFDGTRWVVPGRRVDLRVDTAVGELQLLFHPRGGRDLGIP